MHTFKVGDRVTSKRDYEKDHMRRRDGTYGHVDVKGRVDLGTIRSLYGNGYSIEVHWDGEPDLEGVLFADSNLLLATGKEPEEYYDMKTASLENDVRNKFAEFEKSMATLDKHLAERKDKSNG